VIEGRLEGLVLNQQTLLGAQRSVRGVQRFFQPGDAVAHALRAGIVGAVGKPERDVARAGRLGDLDGIEHVIERLLADFCVGLQSEPNLYCWS
jgi:hypothetical protein